MEKNEKKETVHGLENIEDGEEKERRDEKYLNVGKKEARVHAIPLTKHILRS